jgi:hypothetical protein
MSLPKAYLHLRFSLPERVRIFTAGLKRLGYEVGHGVTMAPRRGDILVTWNRIRGYNEASKVFDRNGCKVLVTENASWGNDFQGQSWYTIARNYHNTADCFDYHGPERWDALTVDLKPFRAAGETVILPQRGIGSKPTAMPRQWPQGAFKRYGGRIRQHPGKGPGIPLERDLANCQTVVTWGSGAAVKALMLGCKVISEMPRWIAEQDNSEQGRLDMFRRLAWAQWTMAEIESGEAFARLLN